MKKLFKTILGVLIVACMIVPTSTFATIGAPCTIGAGGNKCETGEICQGGGLSFITSQGQCVADVAGPLPTDATAYCNAFNAEFKAASATDKQKVFDKYGGSTVIGSVCGAASQKNAFTTIFGWIGQLTAEAISFVGVQITLVLIKFLTFLLYIAAWLLDFVVNEFVLGMGTYVATGTTSGIYVAWTIIRDLANICIIGGLVAAAFGTILQLTNINASKLLARIIIAALLVNFSYFFAAAIIDVSNFTAGLIYQTTIDTGCPQQGTCTLTSRFAQVSNFQALGSISFGDVARKEADDPTLIGRIPGGLELKTITLQAGSYSENLVYNILFIAFLCVTTYVFLSVLALLLGRFVALILLIVSSPLGIAGLAIPGLDKHAKEWWKALFSQALFAPVYFLIVGVSLIILDGFTRTVTQVGHMNIFIGMLIAIIFMILSLRAAKKMSEQASHFSGIYKGAEKLTGWLPKAYAEGLRFSGGVVGRNTVGRLGFIASTRFEKWMAANQDTRLGRVMKASGVDLGLQGGLKKLRDQKFFGREGFGKVRTEHQERDTELDTIRRREKALKAVKGSLTKSEEKEFEHLLDRQKKDGLSVTDQARLNDFLKRGGLKHTAMATAARVEEERNKTNKKWLADQNRYENDEEYLARQEARNKETANNAGNKALEWGRRVKKNKDGTIQKDKKGNYVWEDYTGYRQRIQKLGGVANHLDLDERGNPKGVTFRNAQANVEAEGQKMPDGWLEHLYYENPKEAEEIAPYLSHEQWNEFIKNGKVRRSIKNAARDARFRDYKGRVEGLEEDVKKGKILYGGEEYNAQALELFNVAKKDIKYADEWVDYITSGPGEHLRKTSALWDGSTTGFFKAARESGKIGAVETRNISSKKRRRMYLDAQFKWTGAKLALGADNEVPEAHEDDSFDPRDDALKWAKNTINDSTVIIKNFNDHKGVTVEDKEKAEDDLILARLIDKRLTAKKKIDDLSEVEMVEIVGGTRFDSNQVNYNGKTESVSNATERKKLLKKVGYTQVEQAEETVVGFGEGKQIDEVAIMMQDRSLYHPVLAKLTTDKMMDVPGGQDTRFDEAWLDSKLVSGAAGEIEQLITNDNYSAKFPWPATKERMDSINTRRAEHLENEKKKRVELGGEPLTAEEENAMGAPLPYSPEEYMKQRRREPNPQSRGVQDGGEGDTSEDEQGGGGSPPIPGDNGPINTGGDDIIVSEDGSSGPTDDNGPSGNGSAPSGTPSGGGGNTPSFSSETSAQTATTERSANTTENFSPTTEWQDVPQGAVLPPGVQVRMNISTGQQEVRVAPDTRIYDNLEDDLVITNIKNTIATRQDRETRGLFGTGTQEERDTVERTSNRIYVQGWNDFVKKYPEKAAAYRDKLPEIVGRILDQQKK